MKPSNKLNIDEILTLKWRGLSTTQIQKTDLPAFDRLYEEDPDEFDRLIDKANSIFDKQEKLGIKTITIQDDRYPAKLRAIGNDAPALIFYLGNTDLLNTDKAVAIIGARAADKEGLTAAYKLGKEYAEQGNVVVSGLALGCDTSAHNGCIDGGGKTIAIVGSGLDIIHPRENVPLQRRILEHGGLILSEQLIGWKANPTSLVARNRIQAALSDATILAQCPVQSGSMHTMRFARQYRRKCYAVEFSKATETNGGNRELIARKQAEPLKL